MEFIDTTPSLWTAVSTHLGSQMVHRAVARSGSSPLDVDIGIHPARELATPNATTADQMSAADVLKQLWRIRTLEIDFDIEEPIRERVQQLLNQQAAPILEALHIIGTEMEEMVPVALDVPFLQRSIPPVLRDLEIALCAISIHCPLLHAPTLVSVHLEECKVWGSVDTVLTSLSRWPLLETFVWTWPEVGVDEWNDQSIGEFRVPNMPTSEWKGARVRLPRLKALKIRHEPSPILTIFSGLDLPSSCDLALSFLVESIETEDDESRMRTALDHTLGTYLRNAFGEDDGFTVISVETPRDPTAPFGGTFPGISASWTAPITSRAHPSLIITIDRLDNSQRCKELPLLDHMMRWPQASAFLKHAEVGVSDFLSDGSGGLKKKKSRSDSAWKRLLTLLKSIEHLCVHEEDRISQLFEVLKGEQSVVPKLRLLELEGTHVGEIYTLTALAKRRMDDYSLPPMEFTLRKCTMAGGDEIPLMRIDMTP